MCSNSNIESVVESEGFYIFTGNGSSMRPLIREGVDTVEVRAVSSPLVPGNVVLFHDGNRYVLHRVLKVSDKQLTVRGDNNVSGETVSVDKVIAVMTGLWRGDREVSLTSLRYRLYTSICLRHPGVFRVFRTVFWR